MPNIYDQYLTDRDIENRGENDQCLEVRFRFFSPQFKKNQLLRIIAAADKKASRGALSDSCLDVFLNDEQLYSN